MVKDAPGAELDISAQLVRDLVDRQFPTYRELPLALVGNGWDNAIYRLGDEFSVRLPRRQLAAQLVLNEQTWLGDISQRVPIAVPAPIQHGVPSSAYPWHWSVVPWFAGETAIVSGVESGQAATLADFLTALHQPAPSDAPTNTFRGVPLSDRYRVTIENLDAVRHLVDPQITKAAWDSAVSLEDYEGPPVWLHGDLHPLNIITEDRKISAIIDFGDITSGDPANDLAIAWMLLGPNERAMLRDRYGCDHQTWERARGWAISLALAYLAHSGDNPKMGEMGHRTINAALGSQS